ncbi:hypothetical protein [Streptomyces cylindrosporus]|uniref:UL36 very large tegument protein n=1 Tax=Streptomyces cylindrosporus TaxID=2927583 RepID=A0ABS9Y215_9ACTN|nr:hypothetical protein [Streptomyces cylindrosporus]MCI3271258.1 hypothetical protein [Streptomyces cylindrosporus]
MAVDQLPGRMREFVNYLSGLLARLDQGGGWCAVFWQRDPDGMRACLEGREVPPWDVMEALLQDLTAEYGPAFVAEELNRVRALHTAALTAYDARPGARDALGDRLDVMLREQRYAAERQAELARMLASATTRQQADTIRLDLAWAHDDHERATARCAELRGRIAELDRRATGERMAAARRGRLSGGAVYRIDREYAETEDGLDDTGPAPRGGLAGGSGGPGGRDAGLQQQRGSYDSSPTSGPRGGYAPGRREPSALIAPYGDDAEEAGRGPRLSPTRRGPEPSAARGDLFTGTSSATPAPDAPQLHDAPRSPAPGRTLHPSTPEQHYSAQPTPQYPAPAGSASAQATPQYPAPAGSAATQPAPHYPATADAATHPAPQPHYPTPAGSASPQPAPHYPATADAAVRPAPQPHYPTSAETPAHPAPQRTAAAPSDPAHPEHPAPSQPAPTLEPPAPKKRKRRGSARFAGMVEEDAAPVVVPPTAPQVLPSPAADGGRTPRGARFAGAAEAPARAEPVVEELDAEGAREVAGAVERLVRLRAEGRSGEAHALLVEAAYWPAVRFPPLAVGLQRAGLGADWATLLWEAASLPADRLVAAADALVAAGRGSDGEQILRQGVARPAGEIGRAVLGLATEGRRREVRALLDAYVRVRTPEEAARSAEPDPGALVPLLLEAARGVSDERHWDLVHALRVAGFAA